MDLIIRAILSRKVVMKEEIKSASKRNKVACEEVYASGDINTSLQLDNVSLTNHLAADLTSPQPTLSCESKGAVILAAQDALLAVQRYWSRGRSNMHMLENGFCDQIFIPELLVLNRGMTNLAVSDMQVDPLLAEYIDGSSNFFAEFVYCLKQQRRQLDQSRRQVFDRNWCISRSGHLLAGSTVCSVVNFPRKYRTDVLLKEECDAVLESSKLEAKSVLSLRSAVPFTHESIVGVKILHLFVMDLLGRHSSAAISFKMKAGEK
jgi:hypothetical protein